MTRNRAAQGNVAHALTAEYYAQRAGAGLIITEGTQISPQGVGYPATPGIHSPEQVAGWRLVSNAVHARGGLIFAQLWHVGRISHPDFHDGELPVAPSAFKADGQAFTYEGLKDFVVPRELRQDELPGIVADYRRAAANAKAAGFDGIEIHAANGYLINQFLEDVTNHRNDAYGGPVENRARFLFEVLDAVLVEWSADRVGVRLSPSGTFNGMGDSNPRSIYGHIIEKLNDYQLAYLHLMNPMEPIDGKPWLAPDAVAAFGPLYRGTRLVNGGFTRDTANAAIESRAAELVSFGKLFLANPDLPRRFAEGAPLNALDRAKLYGGGAQGYTDYPALEPAATA